MTIQTGGNVSKAAAYTVIAPPQGISASKAGAYAVLSTANYIGISKAAGYAVLKDKIEGNGLQDILIEMTVYDPAISGTKVLRYSCFGYTTKPTDAEPNAYYEPRIKNPASLKLMLFGDGTTSGASKIGYGEVVLVNNDGMLDPLLNYGIDGRDIVIKQITLAGAILTIIGCGMEQPTFSTGEIAIRIKDPQLALNVHVQPHKYAGNNVLPSGLEGNDDLNGKPKPLIFGTVTNATPVLVNSSKLIYQIHDGTIDNYLAVYDKGVILTEEDDYNTNADMLATAPSPGCYKVQYQTGYFRLGSSPTGQVTFDGGELAGGAGTGSAMYVASRAADTAIPGVGIDGAGELYTLTNGARVGIYITDERTVASVMDDALNSVGGWYAFKPNGRLQFGRLDAPAGTPVVTVTMSEIIDINRQTTKDVGNGLPVWQVLLGYQKNWTVQTATDLAGSVTDGQRGYLSQQSLRVESSDTTVKTMHLMAESVSYDTFLVDKTDAQAEADRRLALRKVRRDYVAAKVKKSALSTMPELGQIVSVKYPRYGYDSGKLFVCIGMEIFLESDDVTLFLWG